MKKTSLSVVLFVVVVVLFFFFLEKRKNAEKVQLINQILIDFNPREAFFNKPTILNFKSGYGNFVYLKLYCGSLLVCDQLATISEYKCLGDGGIEVFFNRNRILINKRSNMESSMTPRENFDFLIQSIYTTPPDLNELKRITSEEFRENTALLAVKAYMYAPNDEIFHIKAHDFEMVMVAPSRVENLWDAFVYSEGNFYSAFLYPESENIQPVEAARLIASFRIKAFRDL